MLDALSAPLLAARTAELDAAAKVTYRLELLCGAVVEPDDPIYSIDPTEEALAACMRRSTFQTKLDLPGEEARLVTLSTCSYEFEDARYIVIGVLTPLEETVKN